MIIMNGLIIQIIIKKIELNHLYPSNSQVGIFSWDILYIKTRTICKNTGIASALFDRLSM